MRVLLSSIAALALVAPAASAQTARSAQVQVAKPTSYLGVGLQEVTSQRAKDLKLSEEAGVEITSVSPDSPASAAGLKVGDVVLQYNGERVEGIDQFTRLVQETPPGRDVKLQISRNGNSQTLTARIGSHAAQPPFGNLPQGFVFPNQQGRLQVTPHLLTPGAASGGELGIQAIQVEGQLADYFGVHQGVLVASVTQGSTAEKAGLKAGDVITRVGDAIVATPQDVSMQLRMARGKTLPLSVTRDHREMTLNATLDDRF